jgi:hypothetical protein
MGAIAVESSTYISAKRDAQHFMKWFIMHIIFGVTRQRNGELYDRPCGIQDVFLGQEKMILSHN